MASVTEFRAKIRGIRSTRQITNAMKMVAGARFARAMREAHEAGAFPLEVEKALVAAVQANGISGRARRYVTLGNAEPPRLPRVAVVAIAGDRGLCGDFNTAVLRKALETIKAGGPSMTRLFCAGKKAVDGLRMQIGMRVSEHAAVFDHLDFAKASALADEVFAAYEDGALTSVVAIHQDFSGTSKHWVSVDQLLPVVIQPSQQQLVADCEPEDLNYAELAHVLLKGRIHQMLRNSYAAELAARMFAMANATRNADNLIDLFTLEANKARQAMITRELVELTSTGEVMRE